MDRQCKNTCALVNALKVHLNPKFQRPTLTGRAFLLAFLTTPMADGGLAWM